MHSPQLAVHIKDLRKGFGEGNSRIDVLRGVDLEVLAGEVLMLVGPSGCGKTTLLCLIAGLLDADGGAVSLWNEDIGGMTSAARTAFRQKNIGFVFQQFNLLPTLTAVENAAIPLLIQKQPRKVALARAAEILERFGLSHRLKALPSKLSGGEQQRVAIARAVASRPRLLICDEPTASLDGETGGRIMELLRTTSLDHDCTVIVVTHDNRIFHFADRIAHVRDGRISRVEATKVLRGFTPKSSHELQTA
jgi:putative ABC transport system ATP-binding protein